MVERFVLAGFMVLIVAGCSSGQEETGWPGQRTAFYNPYGAGPLVLTNPTTEHPPYMICRGDRCFYLDDDGHFTQMSAEERRSLSLGLRLSDENRRFNESRPPLPDPPPPDSSESNKDEAPLRQPPDRL